MAKEIGSGARSPGEAMKTAISRGFCEGHDRLLHIQEMLFTFNGHRGDPRWCAFSSRPSSSGLGQNILPTQRHKSHPLHHRRIPD